MAAGTRGVARLLLVAVAVATAPAPARALRTFGVADHDYAQRTPRRCRKAHSAPIIESEDDDDFYESDSDIIYVSRAPKASKPSRSKSTSEDFGAIHNKLIVLLRGHLSLLSTPALQVMWAKFLPDESPSFQTSELVSRLVKIAVTIPLQQAHEMNLLSGEPLIGNFCHWLARSSDRAMWTSAVFRRTGPEIQRAVSRIGMRFAHAVDKNELMNLIRRRVARDEEFERALAEVFRDMAGGGSSDGEGGQSFIAECPDEVRDEVEELEWRGDWPAAAPPRLWSASDAETTETAETDDTSVDVPQFDTRMHSQAEDLRERVLDKLIGLQSEGRLSPTRLTMLRQGFQRKHQECTRSTLRSCLEMLADVLVTRLPADELEELMLKEGETFIRRVLALRRSCEDLREALSAELQRWETSALVGMSKTYFPDATSHALARSALIARICQGFADVPFPKIKEILQADASVLVTELQQALEVRAESLEWLDALKRRTLRELRGIGQDLGVALPAANIKKARAIDAIWKEVLRDESKKRVLITILSSTTGSAKVPCEDEVKDSPGYSYGSWE